jgi:hypothetical protein
MVLKEEKAAVLAATKAAGNAKKADIAHAATTKRKLLQTVCVFVCISPP